MRTVERTRGKCYHPRTADEWTHDWCWFEFIEDLVMRILFCPLTMQYPELPEIHTIVKKHRLETRELCHVLSQLISEVFRLYPSALELGATRQVPDCHGRCCCASQFDA